MNDRSTAPRQRTRSRRPRRKSQIPREFAPLINAYAADPYQRIELWCYALVLLMIDENQVFLVGIREAAGRTWVTLETAIGEEFEIVKPQLSETVEQQLLKGVRAVVERHIGSGKSQG